MNFASFIKQQQQHWFAACSKIIGKMEHIALGLDLCDKIEDCY